MAQRKLETYFENAQHEYEQIVTDLKKHFKKEVYEEIIALVQVKTETAMNQVWDVLRARYDELSNLEASIPDKPTKEDRNDYLKEFFRLTDPQNVSSDLQIALSFNEMEEDYQLFIKNMSTQEHGEIFRRYMYPSQFFQQLKQAILHNINMITNALKEYAEAMGRHALVLDSVQKGAKEKAFIKGGASLLGMLVGIPFAGAGVGALMGNDQSKINHSLNQVFDQWNGYIDQFNHFLQVLEEQHRLAMMTIYGGTLLRVNDQLNVYHYTFNELALLSGYYSLTITEKERKETEDWIKESTAGINKLIEQKHWQEAIKVAQKLFQIVKQRPVLARSELFEGKSTLYIAHLYFYAAFQEALLEEYNNGHIDYFYVTTKQLYEELPLFFHEKDIEEQFTCSTSLLFRFTKEALKRGQIKDLIVICHYINRVSERWDKEGIYIGEGASSIAEITEQLKSLFIVDTFVRIQPDVDVDGEDDDDVKLTRKQLRSLIKMDAEIGPSDEFTKFLKADYYKSILLPWRNGSFSWIAKHKKKLTFVIVICGLLFGAFTYGEEIYNDTKRHFSYINWFKSEKKPEQVTETIEVIYMKITTEHANVRSAPSLNSEVIHTINETDQIQFEYLNEEQQDEENRTWYLISLPDGQKGWISSKITEKVE